MGMYTQRQTETSGGGFRWECDGGLSCRDVRVYTLRERETRVTIHTHTHTHTHTHLERDVFNNEFTDSPILTGAVR